jgi:hypothetical protein
VFATEAIPGFASAARGAHPCGRVFVASSVLTSQFLAPRPNGCSSLELRVGGFVVKSELHEVSFVSTKTTQTL